MTVDREAAVGLAFSVDTHVFRELGKLLVGRDSTALVELVKNAYDADATRVVLHAERLDSPNGLITVIDDGNGMSYESFAGSFLRIAGRGKEGRGRRTARFGRRYTGAKGIGRLSAYKLASRLAVESQPLQGDGVEALIDWEALEASEGDVQDSNLVRTKRLSAGQASHGTSMALTRLRLELSHGRKQRFLREVRATRPDQVMHDEQPEQALGVELLVKNIEVADAAGPPFVMELSGELDPGDQPWPSLLANIDWVLEVDARAQDVRYRVSPTARRVKEQPAAGRRDFTFARETDGPRFVARVLIRGGKRGERLPDLLETFIGEISGIRLYMEGFRVLPYGSSGNDWLQIDADAVRRNALQYADASLPELPKTDERIYQLSTRNYIGAVFLHEEGSGGLEMVVNREGFMPGIALDEITSLVRRGIDLSVRVRAAVGATEKEQAQAKKDRERQELLDRFAAEAARRQGAEAPPQRDSNTSTESSSATSQLAELMDAATDAASGLRSRTGVDSQPAIELVRAALDEARSTVDGLRDEQAQLRVLASVGTQFGAFIHEVNAVLAQARIVLGLLDSLIDDEAVNAAGLRRARRVRTAMRELAASLERQAIYLTDTIGAEARRRRTRQRVADRLLTARRLLEPAAERRRVSITEDVAPTVRTAPMFPAEVNIVLTNLISNAVKAAAPGGTVHVSATSTPDHTLIRVDNTGIGVDLPDAERWFQPFETTTANLDDILGQGMGLGLPLTRRIVEEYGGHVRFVEPLAGYATGVLVSLPSGRR